MSDLDRLRSASFLAHFDDVQLPRLARCGTGLTLPPSTTLFRERDSSRDVFVLIGGEVVVERHTAYGRYALANLDEGTVVGETSFVDGGPRPTTAVTTSESRVLVLNPVALTASVAEDPRFELALFWCFWKSLSSKLRTTNDRLTRFFSRTGKPVSTQSPATRDQSGSFRVGISAKRDLYEELELSQMEINFLSSLSQEKRYQPGEVLFREGEPGDRMYVILEGRVMISKYIPGAGEEALAFLERGDFFGEMALIDDQPRSADAKAHHQGAVVLSIPREVVSGILDIHKVSSLRLLKILCRLVAKRLRELDEKIVGWFILSAGAGPHG